jgi:hypothetical protein
MIKNKRILGLLGAGAVLGGMLFGTTGAVLAADNTQYWLGNGTTDGVINTSDCDTDSSAHQLWIWTGTGSNVWISVDGEVVQGVQKGNGAYQFLTGWHDIADLTTGDGGNVFVTYDGAVDPNAVLTLSHGCAGETSSSSTSFSQTEESTTDSQSSTSFSQTEESTTVTQPPTDTIGSTGTGQQSGATWLLIAGLGVLLGSVIVLAPARAKTRK